jgi:hypothetical protein
VTAPIPPVGPRPPQQPPVERVTRVGVPARRDRRRDDDERDERRRENASGTPADDGPGDGHVDVLA